MSDLGLLIQTITNEGEMIHILFEILLVCGCVMLAAFALALLAMIYAILFMK